MVKHVLKTVFQAAAGKHGKSAQGYGRWTAVTGGLTVAFVAAAAFVPGAPVAVLLTGAAAGLFTVGDQTLATLDAADENNRRRSSPQKNRVKNDIQR